MVHRHVILENGRTKAAQIYPAKLCQEICRGIQDQIAADRRGQFLLAQIGMDEEANVEELLNVAKDLKTKYRTVEEDNEEELQTAWDDVSGAALDPKMVRSARQDEIDYVKSMNLYTKVPIGECKRETGKCPITVRWIDINKGDTESPNYRSRVVAREINTYKRHDLFAATPPLEALKIILSIAASGNKGEIVMINDVSRAYFHAPAKRKVYVQLPKEDQLPGEEHLCGRLNISMYGTRDAAQNWFDQYSQQLVNIGFKQGIASPCTFYHEGKGIRAYVHGDDYVSVGKPERLDWMKKELEKCYSIKTQLLGPGKDHAREVKILNRIVAWDEAQGISYEADPRHVEIILEQLKLKDSKSVATPGTKEEGRTQQDQDVPLDEDESTKCRALVARCNYLSPDRPDIAFAVNELARSMSAPLRGDLTRLKRLARYFVGKPRLKQWFHWQASQRKIVTYSDADWAGCKATRKSTTGGAIIVGCHTVKGWNKTQTLIALSSGESELYATLRAAAETLGILSMYKEFGLKMSGYIWGDAQAALGIISRNRLGKTRHIDTGLLWIQQISAQQRLKFNKVLGKENPADLYTKHLDWASIEMHTGRMNHKFSTGRATEAPKLHCVSQAMYEHDLMGHEQSWKWLSYLTRDTCKMENANCEAAGPMCGRDENKWERRDKACDRLTNVTNDGRTTYTHDQRQQDNRRDDWRIRRQSGSGRAQDGRQWEHGKRWENDKAGISQFEKSWRQQ